MIEVKSKTIFAGIEAGEIDAAVDVYLTLLERGRYAYRIDMGLRLDTNDCSAVIAKKARNVRTDHCPAKISNFYPFQDLCQI